MLTLEWLEKETASEIKRAREQDRKGAAHAAKAQKTQEARDKRERQRRQRSASGFPTKRQYPTKKQWMRATPGQSQPG